MEDISLPEVEIYSEVLRASVLLPVPAQRQLLCCLLPSGSRQTDGWTDGPELALVLVFVNLLGSADAPQL